MADLLAVSALTFTAAYLILRAQPKRARETRLTVQAKAQASTEQVATTNIRHRMADAIGSGREIGILREQMAQTQRDTEADVRIAAAAGPTRPPLLNILNTTPLPSAPSGAPLPSNAPPLFDDVRRATEQLAEAEIRGDRARIQAGNAQVTYQAFPARSLWLDSVPAAASSTKSGPTRTIAQSQPLVDSLPLYALGRDAAIRLAQLSSISGEPGDAVKLAALQQQQQ